MQFEGWARLARRHINANRQLRERIVALKDATLNPPEDSS